MMKGRLISLLLIVMVSVSHCFDSGHAVDQEPSMRFELIHRHAHQLNRRPETQLDRIKDLLRSDIMRHNMISHKRRLGLNPRREAWQTSASTSNNAALQMPIYSGRDYGTGQYFVSFRIGTPAQKFTMIVDLGSDLTWMNCRYRCGRNCTKKGRINGRRVFQANRSSTFRTVPCLSQTCKIDLMNLFSLTLCPTALSPCAYDYRYLDGSAARGIFAKETVTIGLSNGRKGKLRNVLIGCSDSFQGPSFDKADGVIGLAYSKHSFTAKATEQFGGQFSYCLVDHLSHKNVSNYLIFGARKHKSSLLGNIRYTKLELGLISPFYAVNIFGISVNGVMLDIPSEVWQVNRGGGTILDSGTSLTFLSEPAYRPVVAAFKTFVSTFQRLKLDGVPMEYCFNSTGFNHASVPKLIFHFTDGARFEPHSKSYIIEAADEVKCLGFVSASWPGTSIIGNIMQQNHLWEFDLLKGILAFAPSTCT